MERNGNKISGANEEWQKQGKKKNMLCNCICKKMGYAWNLTVRELKVEQNTFATCPEQNVFSLV